MDENLPAASTQPSPLWNPNAAANWSLLFSSAFGSFLHARNAEALGRVEEAKSNWRWFYGTIIYFVLTLGDIFAPEWVQGLSRFVGLAILLTWYFKVARKQIRFVKTTFGKEYPKKSWGVPLLVAFACLVGLIVVTSMMALVATFIVGHPIVQ